MRRAPGKALTGLSRGQRGGLLMETVVVLAALGVLGSAVLGSVQTGSVVKNHFGSQSEGENLIRNQIEYVLEQAHVSPPGAYLTITTPSGYSVTAEALVYDETSNNIETVRITVYKEGQPIKSCDTLRANR